MEVAERQAPMNRSASSGVPPAAAGRQPAARGHGRGTPAGPPEGGQAHAHHLRHGGFQTHREHQHHDPRLPRSTSRGSPATGGTRDSGGPGPQRHSGASSPATAGNSAGAPARRQLGHQPQQGQQGQGGAHGLGTEGSGQQTDSLCEKSIDSQNPRPSEYLYVHPPEPNLASPWRGPTAPVPLFALWVLEAWVTRARLRDLPGCRDRRDRPLPPVTLCIPARNEERNWPAWIPGWPRTTRTCASWWWTTGPPTGPGHPRPAGRNPSGPAAGAAQRPASPGWLGRTTPWISRPSAGSAGGGLAAVRRRRCPGRPGSAAPGLRLPGGAPADLFTLLPALDTGAWVERLYLPVANMFFLWLVPPLRVADPHSRCCCGVGSFILVRAWPTTPWRTCGAPWKPWTT